MVIGTMEERKAGGKWRVLSKGACIFVRGLAGNQGMRHMATQRTGSPDKRKNVYKGPTLGAAVGISHSRDSSVAVWLEWSEQGELAEFRIGRVRGGISQLT